MKKIRFDRYYRIFMSIKKTLSEDKIGVYAAQASFFVIISAVPFISLLISVMSLFIPPDTQSFLGSFALPGQTALLVGSLLDSLKSAPAVSLLSISALTTLWSAAKGFSALRHGIERIYRTEGGKGYFRRKLQALINTLVFIAFITAVVALLLFGDYLFRLPFIPELRLLRRLRLPLFGVVLALCFWLLYFVTAKGSAVVSRNIKSQLPGAFFAALGWILFSEGYAMYIRYFPGASYVYGGLAAVCLIMLWLWFCISILLLGAELNKILADKPWKKES